MRSHNPTIQSKLEQRIKETEERLAALKAAKEVCDKHPDIIQVFNTLSKV